VRAIGRGSYGEIWLARSLTGAWRAVKIVERARFDDTRAFEREFDGMAKFEPVSREHEGFVDILHVGRSDDDGFFYYVMELADDTVQRPVFDSAVYQPKTLRSELQRTVRLPCAEVVTLGLSLTTALAALHQHGLVHRDIKPANIIFVGGQPKIADIGLVSALGQMSFVGTEGYVPPEGPGSVQADLYSLGKVLYEIAMGKDRLEFPEVSTGLYDLPDREQLLQLNEVLLRACAQYTAERYTCAEEMHRDLLFVRDGRPVRGFRRKRRWMPVAALATAGAGALGWWALRPPPQGHGSVYLETDPPGVNLVLESYEGRWQPSPVRFTDLPAGEHVARVISPLHEKAEIRFTISPGQETRPKRLILHRSVGTVRLISTPPGCQYELREGDSLVRSGSTAVEPLDDLPTGNYELVMHHAGQTKRAPIQIERGENQPVSMAFGSGKFTVKSTPEGAEIFTDGQPQGAAPRELALVEGQHEVIARYKNWPEQKRTIVAKPETPETLDFQFEFGRVKLTSNPKGADIYVGDKKVADTASGSALIDDLPPGLAHFTFKLKNFKPAEVEVMIAPGEQAFSGVAFDARPGPHKGEPWTNSLKMQFVPVGDILVGVWPVRVSDYAAYSADTGKARPTVDFTADPQDYNHPVVRINWEDASRFCEWLTQHEFTAGKLDDGQIYRLPKDAEWSQAAGLPEERGATPEKRDGLIRDFPWGKAWPPPPNAGNFADEKYKKVVPSSGGGKVTSIPGYQDGFAYTSPVGAFPPNKFGLFDMTGNVWQWMDDSYNGGTQRKDWGVLRGGSWGTSNKEELRLGYRNVMAREESDVVFGFRVVIVPEK
jgi:formylglycine-generating enzyme required for sulfatase activity